MLMSSWHFLSHEIHDLGSGPEFHEIEESKNVFGVLFGRVVVCTKKS
jgi:hypothetical protein